jgi:hypothetical protein
MVRMQKTGALNTEQNIKHSKSPLYWKPGILFQKSNFTEFFVVATFERFHPEFLRVNCSFKCIQKPRHRTSGGVVVKWSTKFLLMWQNQSSVLFTEKEKVQTNKHTHTHTNNQRCVCGRTESEEKEEIKSNFAVFVIVTLERFHPSP